MAGLVDKLTTAKQVRELIQRVAQSVQQEAHVRISSIISRCLEAVFPEPYRLEIIFERKRGRTEAKLVFRRGELEADPRSMSGGSVLHVAAFGARLASLLLARPERRKLLVLDEPSFLHSLSAENSQRMKSLIQTLAMEMGLQILLVTHDHRYMIGKLVEL